jgi:hypothetical protein
MTPESGFGFDRTKASGRKSHCKDYDRRRGRAYYEANKDELHAERLAIREAEREAALKALEPIHRKRVAEAKRRHAAQVRRQKEFLRSIGVRDVSPEEVTQRARHRASGKGSTSSGPNFSDVGT